MKIKLKAPLPFNLCFGASATCICGETVIMQERDRRLYNLRFGICRCGELFVRHMSTKSNTKYQEIQLYK